MAGEELKVTLDTSDLWAGEWGMEYIKRNSAIPDRSAFWNKLMKRLKPESVLEVGCNIGHNLRFIKAALPHADIFGVDVNEEALAILRAHMPGITVHKADATLLPYDNRSMEMTIAVGLLIHLTSDEDLECAIKELFRTSYHYVLIAEYWARDWEWINYHGYSNALRKGPFDKAVTALTNRDPINSGRLETKDGFDRVHWWLYRA